MPVDYEKTPTYYTMKKLYQHTFRKKTHIANPMNSLASWISELRIPNNEPCLYKNSEFIKNSEWGHPAEDERG